MNKKDSKPLREEKLSLLAIILAVVLLIFLVSSFAIWQLGMRSEFKTTGSFGDSFGVVNTLFSALAFGGIIYTILLQRRELKLQRDELKETREVFIIQNETLKSQKFENTFFKMVDLHQKIVNSIDTGRDGRFKGADAFKVSYASLLQSMNQDKSFNAGYLRYWPNVQGDYGHYFRNLYRIIKLVDETDFFENEETDSILNMKERYKYTSIIRSQLSDYELLWLTYNCLSEIGWNKFRPLVNKYGLLKNLAKNRLRDQSDLEGFEETAFQNPFREES